MARTSQMAKVGKRNVELSNLEKVLYPEDRIIKAQVIEYYLRIAPTILRHLKGRALSLVRFPDGIHGETFFQKNRPDWAPEWIESVKLGDDRKQIDYVVATEPASLVWLANLACLELHQIHAYKPHFDRPDYFVCDIDPPEGYDFADVVSIALELKAHLEEYGYRPFAKTTGKKGVHIVVPIEPNWPFDEVFEAARDVTQPFVDARKTDTTLHMSKERRKGRVLIDIYRNRPSQTIVAPYSLRGAPGAPVSMPVTWEELNEVTDPTAFNVLNAADKVIADGDPWEALAAFAVRLHTDSDAAPPGKRTVGASRTKKTPEQLDQYTRKRSFSHTPEPSPGMLEGEGNAFVVHRHHASHLHYDLRLEHEGALRSWAVPKGLPPRPGIMRLAVEVEDHPIEYLKFEGEIPKGQYGGGMMWIYALGRYETLKEKKNGFYFRLQSREINAEYRIHMTRGKEWLLERVDEPQINWLHDPIEPMLASQQPEVPIGDYWYELKWDGIRALVSIDEGEIVIRSRNQRDITAQFPELQIPEEAFRVSGGLFDGEIVCFDGEGRPDFKRVVSRLHHTSEGTIRRAAERHPAYCYLFDCLYLDGRPLIRDPLVRRRDWLEDAVRKHTSYRVSEVMEDGEAFFEAVRGMGLEGIVAKDPGGAYQPGKRTTSWIKVKVRQTEDCLIIGYTEGKGDRSSLFGALQVAVETDDGLAYRGKVGTGFGAKLMKEIHAELKKRTTVERPVAEKPPDDAETTWIEPTLTCEVQYASITKNGTFREPVFVRLLTD